MKYTNINRNLLGIIHSYIDYSIQNLTRIRDKSKLINKLEIKLKDGVSMEDVMVKCVLLGGNGFYVYNDEYYMVEYFDRFINKFNLKKEKLGDCFHYQFLELDPDHYYNIYIGSLNVIDTFIIY
jgi:hypothetical protein